MAKIVNDLIINAGLRYDYIDMDSWAWANPQLPIIDRQTHLIPDSAFKSFSSDVNTLLASMDRPSCC